jgi:hypothetical protein
MLEPQVVVNLLPKLGIGADLVRHGYVKLLLAFFGFSPMRSHSWPFTEVVRKIRREVTRKVLLSITFVGTLSETKHCLVSLFVAWAFFIVSIVAVIFAMRSAQLRTHRDAIEAANHLERASRAANANGIWRSDFVSERFNASTV